MIRWRHARLSCMRAAMARLIALLRHGLLTRPKGRMTSLVSEFAWVRPVDTAALPTHCASSLWTNTKEITWLSWKSPAAKINSRAKGCPPNNKVRNGGNIELFQMCFWNLILAKLFVFYSFISRVESRAMIFSLSMKAFISNNSWVGMFGIRCCHCWVPRRVRTNANMIRICVVFPCRCCGKFNNFSFSRNLMFAKLRDAPKGTQTPVRWENMWRLFMELNFMQPRSIKAMSMIRMERGGSERLMEAVSPWPPWHPTVMGVGVPKSKQR